MNLNVFRRGLSTLFGELSVSQTEEITQIIGIQKCNAGDYLFHQGDTDKALYIVVQGLFRSIQEHHGTSKILGDIGISEPVGEFAFFSHEPRSASVVALRDSSFLKVDESAYALLSERFPALPIALTRYIMERLKKNNLRSGGGGKPKNIALIKLDDAHDVEDYTALIKEEFSSMGTSFNIYDHHCCDETGMDELFDQMDNHDGLNFLICDERNHDWTQRSILYSDLIILGAEFASDSRIRKIEQQFKLYSNDLLSKKVFLLLMHEESAPEPSDTRRWFDKRTFDLHIHMRRNHVKDARRFCRILLHKAIGLVLGGGGAKGYAHAGALKAMMEQGMEFDFVGGSSIGALMAIAITRSDFDLQTIEKICREGAEHKVTTNDYDLPMISLMTGNKMRRYLNHFLQDVYIEDLWVSTFCVTTNFSAANVAVHEYGLARKYMEASVAIPGVFPPVIIDKQLHVDGGVMDNLPIEAMSSKPVDHIVAISLTSTDAREINRSDIPSGRTLAMTKLKRKQKTHLPGMTSLLINSLTLSSRQKQEVNKNRASFYMELNLKGFGFLDWTKWKQLIDKGYAVTKEQLDSTSENERFWVK